MPLDITRPSDNVLEFNVIARGVWGSAVPSLYRDESSPVSTGEQHELPGLRVTVLEALDGNPSRVRFEFDRSVDDPSLFFVFASVQGLRRQALPAIGESVRLPFATYGDLRKKP
jgi:hypothetical protein